MKNENRRATRVFAHQPTLTPLSQKRSQVTMFIIIGLLIVMIILLFFMLRKEIKPDTPSGVVATDPDSFLDLCLEKEFEESLRVIGIQGGYVENKLSIFYDGANVSYLCYSQNSYERCVNQEPLLIRHLKQEIHDDLIDDVENCFDELQESLESRDFTVSMRDMEFEVEFVRGRVILDITNQVEYSKGDEAYEIDEFRVIMPSRFFDLAVVVQEILSQESWYCNFDQNGFMLLYPNYDIEMFRTGDSSIIYTVKEKNTEEVFRFAIRGCVIPPGLG